MLVPCATNVRDRFVGTTIQQHRPDLAVFEVVVGMEDVGHELEVAGHGLRALVVALGDPPNESGCEKEFPPEHLVHHLHFTGVEILISLDHRHVPVFGWGLSSNSCFPSLYGR